MSHRRTPQSVILLAAASWAAAMGWDCGSRTSRPAPAADAEPVCADGDTTGCAEFGRRLLEADAGARDDATAADLFRRGCDGRDPAACRRLAALYEQGRGVVRDRSGWFERLSPDAVATYFEACVRSEEQWCRNLWFDVHRAVPGVVEDVQQAKTLYRRACEAGDFAGCDGLGWILAFRYYPNPYDDEEAVELFRGACENGVAAACRHLGTLFHLRFRTEWDEDATAAWRKCLEQDPRACDLVREVDERLAVKLYDRACRAGDMAGCTALGGRLHEGRGPNGYDHEGAAALFRRACEGGDLGGCRELGDLLREGVGVAKDDAQAVAFLERACDGREMLGCLFLAEMLRDGRGGADADGLRTSELYMRACNSGVLEACPIP